jgi:flagellar biosynthetic protein FliR
MDTFITGKILGFLLIATRVGAFFTASPVFNWASVPPQTKTAVAVVLAIFFAGISPMPQLSAAPDVLEIVIWTAFEAIYGLALGLVAYALFGVVRNAARIGEQQMGLNVASEMDPLTEEQENALAILVEIFFILLLFASNGHHILLKIIARSYDRFGIGQIPDIGKLMESILLSGSAMLMLSLQMSAPVLAIFLLLMVVLAIMARVAPESNILFLSLPVRVGLGLLIYGILMPFVNEYLKQFVLWLDRLLVV